jgi:hypothetical protein
MPRRFVSKAISSLVRFDEGVGRRDRVLLAVELLAASAVIVVACANFWLILRAMATTSLWNDELFTIRKFSGKGPWTVLTDYHVANNHVFFNLVNSLTPDSASAAPLRARFWSFAAVIAALGTVLWHFARRRRFIEGALAFALIAGEEVILDYALQARGYGFLCLAGVVLTLSIVRFFETRDNRELYWLAGASILGTWTIPTFLVFAGVALLLLWAWFRTKAVFCCGVTVALAIAVLYSPIATQLWKEMTTYSEQWGESYAQLSAVVETLEWFMWPSIKDWLAMTVLVVALVVPYHLRASKAVLAARFLGIVACASFVLFLFQGTPGVRTTLFVVFPLEYILITIGSQLFRRKWASPRLLATVAAAALAVSVVSTRVKNFSFTPKEAWLEVAEYIREHFPAGTAVHAPFRTFYLQLYLDPAYPIVDTFDAEAFAKGELIYVYSNFRPPEPFNPEEYSERAVAVKIPQRRGGFQLVASVPREGLPAR